MAKQKREVFRTNVFKKDLKRCKKRQCDFEVFKDVIENYLKVDKPLPQKYHDHLLKGEYEGKRECHLTPDWLLIYELEDYKQPDEFIGVIRFERMGTHSDLFK